MAVEKSARVEEEKEERKEKKEKESYDEVLSKGMSWEGGKK